jgi:hypothetical protein
MTMPDEMFNAIRNARMFMVDLLDPKATPKVPTDIRNKARDRLKHFPSEFDISEMENFYNAAHLDKNVIIGETNKQLQRVANEITIAQSSLRKVTGVLQEFINKP